jgi:Zn-dependent peptidase ImmA (M78 family)
MSIQLARNAAEGLVQKLGLRKPPIDVRQVAAALGLRIVQDDLGEGVSGLLVSRDDSASIAVRRQDANVRQRFTIAHEIGHYYLGHHRSGREVVHVDQTTQVIYRNPKASEGLDPLEIQANQFAASLLMPAPLVRERVEGMPRPIREAAVTDLAREFQVSEQAMTIRLSVLGLV